MRSTRKEKPTFLASTIYAGTTALRLCGPIVVSDGVAMSHGGSAVVRMRLTLPDSVFTRLALTAIKRGSSTSPVAAKILDRNLPRLGIAADD
jgi:hypothetical protein